MPFKNSEAKKLYDQSYYQKNREEILKAVGSRHDPVKKSAYNKDWYAKNRVTHNARSAAALLRKQERLAGRPCPDACEVCGKLQSRLSWDHDHGTGAFRGWLCKECNKALGLVYDNPETLRKLADYLERGVLKWKGSTL